MPDFDKAKTIMNNEARENILKSEYALKQILNYRESKPQKQTRTVGY